MKTPEEKITDIIEFIEKGKLTSEEGVECVKGIISSAFTDGILSVHEDSGMLDHPDCPDFEDWWKGDI